MCDGAGACRNWGVGITCVDESCSAGTYTPARVCNGAGTCLAVTTIVVRRLRVRRIDVQDDVHRRRRLHLRLLLRGHGVHAAQAAGRHLQQLRRVRDRLLRRRRLLRVRLRRHLQRVRERQDRRDRRPLPPGQRRHRSQQQLHPGRDVQLRAGRPVRRLRRLPQVAVRHERASASLASARRTRRPAPATARASARRSAPARATRTFAAPPPARRRAPPTSIARPATTARARCARR